MERTTENSVSKREKKSGCSTKNDAVICIKNVKISILTTKYKKYL
jgi:hypothetical protein